jgi:hypothetical protein
MVAWLDSIDVDLFLDAEYGLVKGQSHPLLNISAPLRLTGTAAGALAEEGIEDISETAKYVVPFEGPIEAAVASSLTGTVVLSPFLGVAEDMIRFVDVLEFFLGVRVLVPVGMVLHGLFAKGPANVLFGLTPGDAQDFIIV